VVREGGSGAADRRDVADYRADPDRQAFREGSRVVQGGRAVSA